MKEDIYKIAVVNSSTFGRYFPDLMEKLESVGTVERYEVSPEIASDELAERLEGVDFIIASVTPDFSAEFFKKQGSLKLLARHGIGCDSVDLNAATETGVIVTRVGHEPERDAVAELTLSLIMTCIRDVIPASKAVENDQWESRKEFIGLELSSMDVGVVGYGNIGSRVAEIIQEGFGAEVSAYDPNIADAVIEKSGVRPLGFEEILEESDLLSFNASLNEGNYHFVGKKEFELMQEGVVIVNTARGELIEGEAFADALESGKVRCAGVDVLEKEPPEGDNRLLKADNLYVLPHVGSYTDRSLREMDVKMVRDIENLLNSEIPDEVVNPAVLRTENRSGVTR